MDEFPRSINFVCAITCPARKHNWRARVSRCPSVTFNYGASIEINGKKVALGIPKAQNAASGTSAIPLGRAAHPDEAAAAVLL